MARNPYLKRYKQRLTKRNKKRQRLNLLDDAKGVGKVALAGVGVLAGVHAASSRGLLGTLSDASQELSAAARAFDGADVGRRVGHNLDQFLKREQVDLGSSWRKFKTDFVSKYNKFRMDYQESKLTKMAEQAKGATSNLDNEIRDTKLHQEIIDSIDQSIKSSSDSAYIQEMKRVKNEMPHKLSRLAKMSEKDPDRLRYLMGQTDFDEEVLGDLETILKDRAGKVKSVSEIDVKSKAQKIHEKAQEDIADKLSGKSDSFTRRVLNNTLGYRRATASDMLELHASKDGPDLSQDALNFISDMKDKGRNLDNLYPDDSLLIHKSSGKYVNTKPLTRLKENISEQFGEGLIGKLTFHGDRRHYREYQQRPVNFLKAGSRQTALADTKYVDDNYVLQETMVGVGDKLYRAQDPSEVVKEGLQFTSGKFGTTKRLLAKMSGVNAPNWEQSSWWESKALDISKKKGQTFYGKLKSSVTKHANDDWSRKQIENALNDLSMLKQGDSPAGALHKLQKAIKDGSYDSSSDAYQALEDIYNTKQYLDTYSEGFSENVLRHVSQDLGIHDVSFDTKDEIIRTFKRIDNQTSTLISDRSEVKYQFENNLDRLLERTKIVQDPRFFRSNRIKTGPDLIQREASKFLVGEKGPEETVQLLDDLLAQGKVSRQEYKQARTTVADYIFHSTEKAGAVRGKQPADKFGDLLNLLKTPSNKSSRHQIFQETLSRMSKETHPLLSKGPTDEFKDVFRSETLAVEKFDTKKFFTDPKYFGEQVVGTFTHGRNNQIEKVNPKDLFFFNFVSRINDIIAGSPSGPLALSDESLGSTGQAIKNIYTKRILPIQVGYEGAKYINDHSNEDNQYTLEQRYERAKAATRMSVANVKDTTHVTDALKWLDSVTPGSENLSTLLHDTPVVGWGADWTGITSSKSAEEWEEYYVSGEKKVRDQRFWPLGNSPWMGRGVDHFEPNDYKQAMAEWEYTDTVYGSKEEYWSHSWLPTPKYPMAPIRRFITDPYWFEEKHKKDRPYPLSGQLFDPNRPSGSILNATVGRILKPMKDYGAGATEEDLKEQAEANQSRDHLIGRVSGGQIQFSRYTPKHTMARNIKEYGKAINVSKDKIARRIAKENAEIKAKAESGSRRGVIETSDKTIKGKEVSKEEIKQINLALKERAKKAQRQGKVLADGDRMAAEQITKINQAIKEEASRKVNEEAVNKYGYMYGHVQSMPREVASGEVEDPRDLSYQLGKMAYLGQDIAGARGFMMGMPFGNRHGEGKKVKETAAAAYAGSNRFWDMSPGGRGGALSEVTRRILNHPRNRMDRINRIPNMMPDWLPGGEYFKNFQVGDPYSGKVKRGEIRLPGEAYESMNTLHPDKFGRYGAVDRAAILADVAPYSQQAKKWLKIARSQDLTEEEQKFLQQAVDQSKQQKEKYFITPYKFSGDVNQQEARIKKFVGKNRFLVEGSDQTYRLAGIKQGGLDFSGETKQSQKSLNILSENMMPGSKVTLITEPGAKKGQGSTPVVVKRDNRNINRQLIQAGAESKKEDGIIDAHARYNQLSRTIGSTWEKLSHLNVPFHDKVVAADSPTEHLKRFNLYDKSYKDWNQPVEDWIEPAYNTARAQHPIGAGITLGFTSGMASLLLFGPKAFKPTATAGFVGGMGLSVVTRAQEISSGKAWIPPDEQQQREINRYFDVLKHVKNKRLYEKYSKLAEEEEGVNLEEIVKKLEKTKDKVSRKKSEIKNIEEKYRKGNLDRDEITKKWVNSEGRVVHGLATDEDYIKSATQDIKEKISELKGEEAITGLGKYAKKAIKYRRRYKSTLYAIEGDSSYSQIYRALPSKDRDYFKHFANETNPEKREKILKLVPENQKRMYRKLWGMETEDRKPTLKEFFSEHYLPNKDWVGWKEGVDLEDSKVKVIKNEGLDADDFGVWEDHTEDEKLTPAPAPPTSSYTQGTPQVKSRLRSVLEDVNLEDVQISVKPRQDDQVNVNMDLKYDVKDEAKSKIESVLS